MPELIEVLPARPQVRHDRRAPPETRFTLTRFVELVAQAVLLGAICAALQPFTGWWVALPVALTLTYSFSQLVHMVLRPGALGWRLLAASAALVLACVTSSLTYSSIYAGTAAQESARRDFAAKRERTQRELQRMVSTAESARQAMQDWAATAGDKSRAEAVGGNTCPGRGSNRLAGPISTWRADDAQVAQTLVAQLQSRLQMARAAVGALQDLPEPSTYAQVRQGYALLNHAVELSVPLTRGGWAGPSLVTLADRRGSQIQYPGGVVVRCGDTARLALIDSAALHLRVLDEMPALARLNPVIDLDKPQEVTTRGLVRGMNLLVMALSAGQLGQFKDDPLMTDALKMGAFTRETVPFGLAILAELGVLFTAMLRRQAGNAPFSLNLPAWVHAHRKAQPSPHQTVVLAASTLLSNLFYARTGRQETTVAAVAMPDEAPESSFFGSVTLAPDPTFRARETLWARLLQHHLHSWGDEQDYLLLPRLAETRAVRFLARCLASHGLLRCRRKVATWQDIADTPLADDVRLLVGDRCSEISYDVYAVRPDYAQVLRLALIDFHLPGALLSLEAPDAAASAGQTVVEKPAHQSLRCKLKQRAGHVQRA